MYSFLIYTSYKKMMEIFNDDFIYVSPDMKYDSLAVSNIKRYVRLPQRGVTILTLFLVEGPFHTYDDKINSVVNELTGHPVVADDSMRSDECQRMRVVKYKNVESFKDPMLKVGDVLIIDPMLLEDKTVDFYACELMFVPWCNYIAMRIHDLDPKQWSLYELYKIAQKHLVDKCTREFANVKTHDGTPNSAPLLLNDYDSAYEAYVLDSLDLLPLDTTTRLISERLGEQPLDVLRDATVTKNLFAVKQPVVAQRNTMRVDKVLRMIQNSIDSSTVDKPIPTTLEDIEHEIPYTTTENILNPYNIHIGQRKLLITELLFINTYHEPGCLYVYAGASPGYHINFIKKYIPDIHMLLIDASPIYVEDTTYLYVNDKVHDNSSRMINHVTLGKETSIYDAQGVKYELDNLLDDIDAPGIYIYEDVMTIPIARELAKFQGKKKVMFLSDIRTEYLQDKRFYGPSDADILLNTAQQMTWIHIMQPSKYCVKFRLPFYFDKQFSRKQIEVLQLPENRPYIEYCIKHFDVNYENQLLSNVFSSFDADIVTQPWTKTTSTETRLVGDSTQIVEYTNSYRNRLFYYNNVLRLLNYKNIEPSVRKEPYTCQCGDCCYEYNVIKKFKEKFSISTRSIHELQTEIGDYMGPKRRGLKMGYHPLR